MVAVDRDRENARPQRSGPFAIPKRSTTSVSSYSQRTPPIHASAACCASCWRRHRSGGTRATPAACTSQRSSSSPSAVIAKLPRGAAAKAKASSSLDELLGAILANLASDEARRVYGDHLHDQGDPRGELIALQLGPSSEAADKRCRALLKTNRAAWLGELDALVVNPQFRRGFLSGIELRPSWAGGAGGWHDSVASPLLATIEEIHQGKCNGKLYDAPLAAPGLRALRATSTRLPRRSSCCRRSRRRSSTSSCRTHASTPRPGRRCGGCDRSGR